MFDKPYKHDTGYQTDNFRFQIFTIVFFSCNIVRKGYIGRWLNCPLVPFKQVFVELLGQNLDGECGSNIAKCLFAIFKYAKLFYCRTTAASFAKQIGITLRIGRDFFVIPLFVESPRFTYIRKAEYAFILSIAKHESTCITHIAPVRSKHITDSTPIALNCQLFLSVQFHIWR